MTVEDGPLRDRATALATLDRRLRLLLPEAYQDSYETVEPVSMGSAGLKYDRNGRVAWDEIWGSFCDLAMAGGPPHKGTLLEPASPTEIDAQPDRYETVAHEICRGVSMATGLDAERSYAPGWIAVACNSPTMAEWLARAITMENIAVRSLIGSVFLPAGPSFRLEKEIKNVVTVIAKTSHYWLGHMSRTQHQEIGDLLARLNAESPLLIPAAREDDVAEDECRRTAARIADRIRASVGMRASELRYFGWCGLECASVGVAVWLMRAMVANNVLARREGTVLFLPVHPVRDLHGARAIAAFEGVHDLAVARGIA